jgi:hypothetical protein
MKALERSPQLAARICELAADGRRLVDVAAIAGMPTWPAMMAWLKEDDAFRAQYESARTRCKAPAAPIEPATSTGTGDELADEILATLQSCRRLTRTQVSAVFGRNQPRDRIVAALATLGSKGLVRSGMERGGLGRPTQFFELIAERPFHSLPARVCQADP